MSKFLKIDGTHIPPPETSLIVVDFLVALTKPNSIKERKVSLLVNKAENKEGWGKIKKKTVGDSGIIGFSHYKTCSEYDDLNLINTFLRNVPFIIEVLPDQFMTIIDLQILKQIIIFNVDRMRCIHLMNSEFNMKNKLVGKRMMANTEAVNAIRNDQFDNREKHKAINTYLKKVLTNDIFRQKNMLQHLEWQTTSVASTEFAILLFAS